MIIISDRLEKLSFALEGLNELEWTQIKTIIDSIFKKKVTKIELDDQNEILDQLKTTIISPRLVSEKEIHDILHHGMKP